MGTVTLSLLWLLAGGLLRPPEPRSYDVPEVLHPRASSAPSQTPLDWTSPAGLLTTLIRGYQATLSRVQGDVCNFTPSCSHFALQAVQRYGPLVGLLLASDRLQRCHYWAWRSLGVYYGARKVPGRGLKLVDPVERYP